MPYTAEGEESSLRFVNGKGTTYGTQSLEGYWEYVEGPGSCSMWSVNPGQVLVQTGVNEMVSTVEEDPCSPVDGDLGAYGRAIAKNSPQYSDPKYPVSEQKSYLPMRPCGGTELMLIQGVGGPLNGEATLTPHRDLILMKITENEGYYFVDNDDSTNLKATIESVSYDEATNSDDWNYFVRFDKKQLPERGYLIILSRSDKESHVFEAEAFCYGVDVKLRISVLINGNLEKVECKVWTTQTLPHPEGHMTVADHPRSADWGDKVRSTNLLQATPGMYHPVGLNHEADPNDKVRITKIIRVVNLIEVQYAITYDFPAREHGATMPTVAVYDVSEDGQGGFEVVRPPKYQTSFTDRGHTFVMSMEDIPMRGVVVFSDYIEPRPGSDAPSGGPNNFVKNIICYGFEGRVAASTGNPSDTYYYYARLCDSTLITEPLADGRAISLIP
eukprot:GHVN01096805.1.p1 GENE.GHVN01096805.1~~GHVN01096805.1.p1  ORF type:complete len:508 (-),score=30.45 GHVN01096805.1:6-1334(-)